MIQFSKVIILKHLWKKMLDVGRKTHAEVAFHLIGTKNGDLSVSVLDVIETDYNIQSGGFIRSGLRKEARIKAGLPVGLEYLGIAHKHPGSNSYNHYEPTYSKSSFFSGTDHNTFTRHWREGNAYVYPIYHSDASIASYSVDKNGNVEWIETIIVDDTEVKTLIKQKFHFDLNIEVLYPEGTSDQRLKLMVLDRISDEIEKLYKRGQLKDRSRIEPLSSVNVQLGNNPNIMYRFYMSPDETLENLRDEIYSTFDLYVRFKNGGSELSFNTKIKDLNSSLHIVKMRPPHYFENKLKSLIINILDIETKLYFLKKLKHSVMSETEFNLDKIKKFKDKLENKLEAKEEW